MYRRISNSLGFICLILVLSSYCYSVNWSNWRGPDQNGFSTQTQLPDTIELDGKNHLWTFDLAGRGTPVIADGKLYTLGYEGEGADFQELLICLDAKTGKEIWRHGFNDFLSDIIYERYAIGSPTIDSDTGNIYAMTSAGLFNCFNDDGKLLWQISMMESFGRLTFPNGRTGAAVIDDDRVIVHGITTNWGKEGPPRDRFYAFDKATGELVWSCTPGVGPKDSSFSTPVFDVDGDQRVFYCGTGCGNVVCVNAQNGKALWRYQFSQGGVNSSLLIYKESLIAIHGKENLDTSDQGRMIRLKRYGHDSAVLSGETEVWRADLAMFTSSPTLAGNRIYQVGHTGELFCLDAESGKILWQKKLANMQLHASPLYADNKLYIPISNGLLYIIRPTDAEAETLCKIQLAGNALGSPSVYLGKVFVHTTEKLYCFARDDLKDFPNERTRNLKRRVTDQKISSLQIVPAEVLLRPGEKKSFRVWGTNNAGARINPIAGDKVKWEKFIPPTAKVKVKLNGKIDKSGQLLANQTNLSSAGAFRATTENARGTFRGRILPKIPFAEDFERFTIRDGQSFAYPPLPWIGARFKWQIQELDGNKVLAKTLDRVLFQRATTFLGHPDAKSYALQADIMTDGNRRIMSSAGLINQRYVIALIGNSQLLEVSSNHDRIKVSVPFSWKPKLWYRLKTRVDVNEDGSGVIRAKAWKRSQPEPDSWTIEVPHKKAHTHGAPGLWGFSPQSQFPVYLDNVIATPNN
jgi:outer membrane protein assembly factor BamB